jgi:cytochrome c
MVGWILSLGDEDQPWTAAGTHGQFVPPRQPPPGRDGGVYVVSASYTDAGAPAAGPQTGTASLTFHARRKNAVLCDESRDVDVLDVFEGGLRQVGQFNDGGYIQYRRVSLADVSYLKVQYAASEGRGGRLELRHGNLSGPLRAALDLPATGEWHHWKQVTAPITGSGELQDLFLVARGTGGSGPLFNIEWVEFLASPPAAQ